MEEKQEQFDISEHMLVPTHVKLSEEDKQAVLTRYNISLQQLPQIHRDDPAISKLDPQVGDLIEVRRKSPTTGETSFYRVVVNG